MLVRFSQCLGMSVALSKGQQRKEHIMHKIASLTTLFSAGSLLLSVVVCAQPQTEDETYSTSPPPAATEPSVAHNQEAQEPAGISQEATDSDALEPSSEQQARSATKPAQESIPLAISKPAHEQTLVSSNALV